MGEGAAAPGVPFIRLLADFAAELRAAGLTAGTGDLLAYGQAMSTLDPADLLDLYWAGRATLVSRRDSIATFDAVFRRFFLGAPATVGSPAAVVNAVLDALRPFGVRHADMPLTPANVWSAIQGRPVRTDLALG